MKNKRLFTTIITLIGNFIIFYVGIRNGADLISLGTGLAIINLPLVGYQASETIRPSGTVNGNKID